MKPRVRIYDPPAAGTPLTAREIEVAKMIALGYDCDEIAAVLEISVKTYDCHRRIIMHKLGIADAGTNKVARLARIAIREGWVPAPTKEPSAEAIPIAAGPDAAVADPSP